MARTELTTASTASQDLHDLWARHNGQWRDTAQVTSQWEDANKTNPEILRFQVQGAWWDTLAESGITLLVTREYEHLVMAVTFLEKTPHVTFMAMPHPSGLAIDKLSGVVHIASTRNPNQIYHLRPVLDFTPRLDVKLHPMEEKPLVPVASHFFPGCLYMHDLALINNALYANAVGQNAVVHLKANGSYERVWWPRCIEANDGPVFGQNHIQLNSIAAGPDLGSSFFSASSDKISSRRPGHQNYPVDRRGVIFAGTTRDVMVRGLTRPHSARLHRGRVWVDNSGYGEMGVVNNTTFDSVMRLPGWTRGLCFFNDIAFVGTSRVIPRFRQYAPGLTVDSSVCGVHAIDIKRGHILGSLIWPQGNQIFAVDWIPQEMSTGFAFTPAKRKVQETLLFYTFSTNGSKEDK